MALHDRERGERYARRWLTRYLHVRFTGIKHALSTYIDSTYIDDYKATFVAPTDYVFATRNGTAMQRSNLTRQIVAPAIVAADKRRAAAGLQPIRAHVTNHSLRRTFASLLYEAGASPAFVMSRMGHESSGLALAMYAKVMERKREVGARMDELVRGARGSNGQ